VHAVGQRPSDAAVEQARAVTVHTAVQFVALPESTRMLSWSETQLLAEGQLPSHVSPGSTTPLGQTGAQLLSLFALQVPGQHASPFAHAVMVAAFTHCRVHAAPESDRS